MKKMLIALLILVSTMAVAAAAPKVTHIHNEDSFVINQGAAQGINPFMIFTVENEQGGNVAVVMVMNTFENTATVAPVKDSEINNAPVSPGYHLHYTATLPNLEKLEKRSVTELKELRDALEYMISKQPQNERFIADLELHVISMLINNKNNEIRLELEDGAKKEQQKILNQLSSTLAAKEE